MPTDELNTSSPRPAYLSISVILRIWWVSRSLILYFTIGVTGAVVIFTFLMSPTFRSEAVVLPEVDKSKLGGLGGISELAAMVGVSGGEGSLVKLYPTIARSEAVLMDVIYKKYRTKEFTDSVTLIQFWKIDGPTEGLMYERALKKLRQDVEVALEIKTSVLTIALETTEPQLSADIVNEIVKKLDEVIRTKRKTNATEQRKWIESRLEEVKMDLEHSENNLKEFREKNRRITDSPKLLLEQERLLREIQINSALYLELKRQYELIKIEEIKNVPIISVLDQARPAASREKPHRAAIALIAFYTSIFSIMVFVLLRHLYGARMKEFVSSLRMPHRE